MDEKEKRKRANKRFNDFKRNFVFRMNIIKYQKSKYQKVNDNLKNDISKRRGYTKKYVQRTRPIPPELLWEYLREVVHAYEKCYKKETNHIEKKILAEKILSFIWEIYHKELKKKEFFDGEMLEMLQADDLTDKEKEYFKKASWYFEMRDIVDTYTAIIPDYIFIPRRDKK